jgi:shikimate kinase
MPPRNVILIGYRGCGKTSVGRELAARLRWPFADTDEQVEAAAGRSVREIFEQDGEAFFRQLETRVIAQVTGAAGQVIAVGGGAVLSAANRAALQQAGVCIWLTAPATELHRRLQADPRTGATRPALTARGRLAEVRHLLAERRPLYADLAQHVVPTRARSIPDVVEAVLSAVAKGGLLPEAP